MDSSRRAVESYWRSRMIDVATSDEDKVTPVYKLEEICQLLQSSNLTIVKEVSEFVLKRLQHKSPVVKYKALRLIKYAVLKSGAEFRREMQRNSVAVRQLIHYKGQPDPLKGDAPNKAVREMAQEALSAIFSADDNKPAPAETLGSRIQGFGNTNFEMASEDKKSFLSEVVGLGSATIKQGLSTLAQSQSLKNNETGTYKSPNLRRSLTRETNYSDPYEGVGHHSEIQNTSHFSVNPTGGSWGQDMRMNQIETTNGDSGLNGRESKTREERLLETIVTSGGVRLQPTRDALYVFLVEASKLDALALSHALESKLQSPLWQVRMKAVCVLEAILRKLDDDQFSIVSSYFSENKDVVVKCSESPQASLREKANKVLSLLGGEQTSGGVVHIGKPEKAETTTVQMPDLIDTGDPDDLCGSEHYMKMPSDQSNVNLTSSSTIPLVDDLFGDNLGTGASTSEQRNDDDPFADVSFHNNNDKEHVADLFLGMTIDKPGDTGVDISANKNGGEVFDSFGFSSEFPQERGNDKKDVHDLMAGFSMTGNNSLLKQNGTFAGTLSENVFSDSTRNPSAQVSNDVFNNVVGSQAVGMNANPMFPVGPMAYNLPSELMFSPVFPSQPINYNAMGSLLAQQQFLATMSNFQHLGNLHSQSAGVSHAAGTLGGGYASALPDIFNPSVPTQTPTSMMNNSKKEETKAFDFISDHLATARGPNKVI